MHAFHIKVFVFSYALNSSSALIPDFCEAGADSAVTLTLQWLCPSFPPGTPVPALSPSLLPTVD